MIVKIKMCTRGKIFGEICLKAIFFSNIWSAVNGGIGWDLKERGRTQFLVGGFRALSIPCLSCKSWSSIKNTVTAWSSYDNNFGKIEKVFFFKATHLQHLQYVRVEMEKRRQNLYWRSMFVRLSLHFKVRSI